MSFNDYMRVLCLICVAAFAGCGGATDAPDLAKAEGVVLYKDAPLAGAMVTFVVEGSPLATGETNGEGKFVISTGGRPGAPVGSAKVGIVKNKAAAKDTSQLSPEDMIKMAEAGGTGSADESTSEIPVKYNDPQSSGLVANIDADESKNVFEFRIND